ncbi:protoglobin domain-containing protein [Leifsonia bigeumensis]|uniref:Protoglobin domain-containing protein n=1 Tax=Leifsonella bigeumensis TaxID=433643 RepID=A0ABP7FFK2_9MICO
MNHHPAGYSYGDTSLAPSPVSIDTLAQIQRSVLWSEDDSEALRRAGEILVPQTEQILDVWYGFVGANPHLVATFAGSDGQPDGVYLAAVRERFGRWIADLCARPFDADWLAYQEEIALRHHTRGKNRTDGVDSPSGHVPLSHLIALIVPITVTIRDFLGARGADPAEVDAMYHAWMKAVTLSVVLWTRPYNPELW